MTGAGVPEPRVFHLETEARSYEMDSFGHLNHAVYLNHFEFARFGAFAAAGFPAERLLAEGTGIHVVRIEVDYKAEVRMGQRLRITTRPLHARNTSMTLEQVAADPAHPERHFARALVTLVWIGPGRRPTRIPREVREALGVG